MAIYRKIHLSFWTDEKVDDDFTPEDKYFYLYLLTNPHTNICGCYQISNKQFERETGYNCDTIGRLLQRMECVHNVIKYDKVTKEILLLNWGKYNWSKSPKLISSVLYAAQTIKSKPFCEYIKNYVTDFVGSDPELIRENASKKILTSKTETDKTVKQKTVTEKTVRGDQSQLELQLTDVSIDYGYSIDTVSDNENVDKVVDNSVDKIDDGLDHPSYDDFFNYITENDLNINPKTMFLYLEYRKWKDADDQPIFDWKSYLKSCSANKKVK